MQDLLGSSVLRRSEQLRRILAYISTEEIEGRGTELTESSIAIQALGRAGEYSPETDSTVRTRTYELRKRLDEHYRKDGRGSVNRLELPKGTYRPCFYRVETSEPAGTDQPRAAGAGAPSLRGRIYWLVTGVLAGCLLMLAAMALVGVLKNLSISRSPGEIALNAVWGPLLKTGGTVTIVVATPMQLWLRDFADDPNPRLELSFLKHIPWDQQLTEWYRKSTLRAPQALFAQPNSHSPLWGDAAAATTASRFLAARGINVELLPEAAVRQAALKDRNAILIGRGDYSSIVEPLMPEGGYLVRYVAERKDVGIASTRSNSNEPGFFRQADGRVNYGLVTVRTSQPGHRDSNRYFIVSGINSDGSQAGMEFLASPDKLLDLRDRLKANGYQDWPDSFQVVVRTISSDSYSLQSQYAAHRVFR